MNTRSFRDGAGRRVPDVVVTDTDGEGLGEDSTEAPELLECEFRGIGAWSGSGCCVKIARSHVDHPQRAPSPLVPRACRTARRGRAGGDVRGRDDRRHDRGRRVGARRREPSDTRAPAVDPGARIASLASLVDGRARAAADAQRRLDGTVTDLQHAQLAENLALARADLLSRAADAAEARYQEARAPRRRGRGRGVPQHRAGPLTLEAARLRQPDRVRVPPADRPRSRRGADEDRAACGADSPHRGTAGGGGGPREAAVPSAGDLAPELAPRSQRRRRPHAGGARRAHASGCRAGSRSPPG